VIKAALAGTGFPLLSEEGKQLPYEERKDWTTFWLVDPLDGTKEFIKKNGEFTVNIALVKDGKPVLGVVYVPVTWRFILRCGRFGQPRSNYKGRSKRC
jgi:3'(2'), 5'-bisphosphate nucleotidase